MSVSVEVKNGKNRYKPSVVENNWFEERADYSLIREDKPLNFVTPSTSISLSLYLIFILEHSLVHNNLRRLVFQCAE